MSTALKGNMTEALVLCELVRRDLAVLLPFGEGRPYDLVVDLEEQGCLKVQCKTARFQRGCVVFNGRSTDHGRGPQSYLGLADVFGVYCPHLDQVYLVPVSDVPGFEGRLRVEPTRNKQRRGIRSASRYEIDQWTREDLADILARRHRGSDGTLTLVSVRDL